MIAFESIVQSDPTLKYFMRDAKLTYNNLEHQVNLRASAILIAIGYYINKL